MSDPTHLALEELIVSLEKAIADSNFPAMSSKLVIGHDGVIKVFGDNVLYAIVTKVGAEGIGLRNPMLPRGVSINVTVNDGQVITEVVSLELPGEAAKKHPLEEAAAVLMGHSTVTIHEDGRITGTGMGHYIARSMRKATPGDPVYHLIHDPSIEKPHTIQLIECEWQMLTNNHVVPTYH